MNESSLQDLYYAKRYADVLETECDRLMLVNTQLERRVASLLDRNTRLEAALGVNMTGIGFFAYVRNEFAKLFTW